jgi:ABC-2 type transport system ATP-binding protein
MSSAIETIGLCKSFKGTKAVDELNLSVPEGSVYGFLGPNGAGKTTTLKMLTGLTEPTSGIIKICGQEVKFGSHSNRTDIGFLPDVPNFYNWMTPSELLQFTGELFSIDRKQLKIRIDELLDLVGLSGAKKKIGGFSRGMKQRLGIAQALINQPKVVFMDEPVSALDPIGRKEVMDILLKLSGRVTVFFSSHILSDIEKVCDRVLIMDKGRMILEDSIENLRERYSSGIIGMDTEEPGTSDTLMQELNGLECIKKVERMENGELKIYTRNLKNAQVEIPSLIGVKGTALKKFVLLEPTLEDIFMKVVEVK